MRFILALSLICLSFWQTAYARDYLVFTPLPMEEARLVVEKSQPMVSYLEAVLSMPIRIRYVADYAEILNLFAAGEIDIAHLGPFSYVALKQYYPEAEPLLVTRNSDGSASYSCWIVSPIDGVKRVEDIDQSFALTQQLSTCGPITVAMTLNQYGVNLSKLKNQFLGTHDEVALAVLRKEFQAGSLSSTIASKYVDLGLNVLHKTENLPLFPLVVNGSTVLPEYKLLIKHGLLSLQPEARSAWGLGNQGFLPANDKDYDVIRDIQVRAHVD